MGSIAKISGVALAPGVSRNRRLYTPELIAKAAKRMQERLADPEGLPIVMRTHHDAGDDSAKIVGRVTEVTIDSNQALRYKADLYDTRHGQDIAALVTPDSPALRSVSIHGYWMGTTKQVPTESGTATTADDLEIDAIDFTASPGVDGALIDSSGKATESGGILRTSISESMEAAITLLEEGSAWVSTRGVQHEGETVLAVAEKYGWTVTQAEQVPSWLLVYEAKYSADDMKGLLAKGQAMKNANGDPSYPIADISDLKKAILAVGRGNGNHDAIRAHIMKRAKALGATNLIPDNWGAGGKMKESAPVRMSEIREYYPDGPGGVSGFCIDAYSGPLSVTVRGCVSPDELRDAATAAMCAAINVFNCMDPDEDADIDTSGDEADGASDVVSPDDDMDGETVNTNAAGAALTQEDVHRMIAQYLAEHDAQLVPATEDTPPVDTGTTTSSPVTAESDNKEELAMGETNQAAEAAPTQDAAVTNDSVLGGKIDALAEAVRVLVEMNTPKQAADTQETTETAAEEVTAETVTPKADIDIAELKESLAKELRTELRNELRSEFLEEKGLPPRRGYRLTENDEPQELSNAELFDKYRSDILLGSYAPTPAPSDQAS